MSDKKITTVHECREIGEELKEARDAATAGPWSAEYFGDEGCGIWFVERDKKDGGRDVFEDPTEEDCRFVAHARTSKAPEAIEFLVEEVKKWARLYEAGLETITRLDAEIEQKESEITDLTNKLWENP